MSSSSSDEQIESNKMAEIPDGFELAEVSAAKNIVLDVLLMAGLPEETPRIDLADRIVADLMTAGVLIPEWVPDPAVGGKPAQGYFPTASQMEAWEGRKVTPRHVTGVRAR